MADEIKALRGILQVYAYEQDNSGLCRAFQIFGGISFVANGMTVPDDFFTCFAKRFAKKQAEGEKCLKAKFIKYDFQYILYYVNGEPFYQANGAGICGAMDSHIIATYGTGYILGFAKIVEKIEGGCYNG